MFVDLPKFDVPVGPDAVDAKIPKEHHANRARFGEIERQEGRKMKNGDGVLLIADC